MGADIHLVVEYAERDNFSEPAAVASMAWPRQSDLFAAMSGMGRKPALIPARGFPKTASNEAYRAYGLQVVKPGDVDAMLTFPSILEEEAREALDARESELLPYCDFISNPAYCWASWLTRAEFRQCVEHSGIAWLSLEAEATLAMMELIESRGHKARIVFWFDL